MFRNLCLLVLFLFALFFLATDIKDNHNNDNDYLLVEIKGAVEKQEVIKIKKGSNINDLLKLVNLNEDADLSTIALQDTLYNNQVIVIPYKKQYNLISINSADIDQLITLPGIGKTIALRIIEYRNTYGSFNNLDDLKNVKGIGEIKFEKIREYISL